MDRQQILATVVATLQTIAPEIGQDLLAPAALLRDQVDLDSMDWLNFLIGLHERFHVDIPQADYGKLATLDQLTDYLLARQA